MKPAMIFLAISALTLFSCVKNNLIEPGEIIENPTLQNLPVTVNKSLMLELVNEIRQKGCQCGDTYYNPAPAVSWNDKLGLAAYKHSADMYKNKYFNHVSPNGDNAGDRIELAGYNWVAYGENIGSGYTSERSVVESWLKSPNHCKNIMNSAFKEMGAAKVGTYWTQIFASSGK